jgi:flagellar hook assembly protein FlgD
MIVAGVGDERPAAPTLPARLALRITPNPVLSSTTLHWDLPRAERVRVGVFDASGRQVARIADETYPAGSHTFTWRAEGASGEKLATGVYFVRLDAGQEFISRKLLVVH